MVNPYIYLLEAFEPTNVWVCCLMQKYTETAHSFVSLKIYIYIYSSLALSLSLHNGDFHHHANREKIELTCTPLKYTASYFLGVCTLTCAFCEQSLQVLLNKSANVLLLLQLSHHFFFYSVTATPHALWQIVVFCRTVWGIDKSLVTLV